MSWFDLDPPVDLTDAAGRPWHLGIRHLYTVVEGFHHMDLAECNRSSKEDLTFMLDLSFGNFERADHSLDSWQSLGRTLAGLVLPKHKLLGRAWARIALTAAVATSNRSAILSLYTGFEEGELETLWPLRNAIRFQVPVDLRVEARWLTGMMDSAAWSEVVRVVKSHTNRRRIGVATRDIQREVIRRARVYRLHISAAAAFLHLFQTAARIDKTSSIGETANRLDRSIKRSHCDFEWTRELENYHWK